MIFSELLWEKSLLQKDSFRLNASNTLLKENIELIRETLNKKNIFVSTRIKTSETQLFHVLQDLGFKVIECYLEFQWYKSSLVDFKLNPTPRVFKLDENDSIELISLIATNSFIHSRFHLDPLIPLEIANKSREEWVKNGCLGRADTVLVAKINNIPVGFLLIKWQKNENEKICVLDLMAVDTNYRGLGLGKELVQAFNNYAVEQHADFALVGTQASNREAIHLYEKNYFRFSDSYYSLHYHS